MTSPPCPKYCTALRISRENRSDDNDKVLLFSSGQKNFEVVRLEVLCFPWFHHKSSFFIISHRSLLFLRQKCLSTQLHTGCAPAPKAMSTTTPSFSEHQHFTFIIVFSIWIKHFYELVLIGRSCCPHSYIKLERIWMQPCLNHLWSSFFIWLIWQDRQDNGVKSLPRCTKIWRITGCTWGTLQKLLSGFFLLRGYPPPLPS